MQQGYRSRGSSQPQKLRFPCFSRPHSFVYSEHQPKECAGRKEKERKETKKNKKKGKERRLVRYRAERARAKGKGEGCHSHAPTLNEHSPSAFPLQAGGPAGASFLLPAHSFGWFSLWAKECGPARSASSLPFCCRRTPLVSFLFLSAAGASAGSEAFVAGRSLWTASALKAMRSRYLSTLGLLSSGAVGVAVSHPLSMREGLGSIPGLSMPMCACVCHSLPLPGLSSLWVCCASCQDRLVRRGRVPNITFESYIESRKLSVPGRDQQEQLRVQRAWRPHSLRRSEHEPKECAGSLLRRGRVPNVAFESNMQQGYRSVQRPLFAVGKRARPGKALKHLQGTVFSAAALSRPARPAFSAPAHSFGWFSLWAKECGPARSASSLPFCCRRTPLVSFLFLSAAGASAGSEAFVAGRSLWTASALKAMRSRYLSTLGLLSSGAVGVVVSHPLSMREGLGSIPGLSMPMCACVCHSLPLPGLSFLWVCCASCQDRLVRRGRVPNVTFESYIESRKLSAPRARPARTASRPARLEAALASPQRARTKGVRRQPAPPRPGA